MLNISIFLLRIDQIRSREAENDIGYNEGVITDEYFVYPLYAKSINLYPAINQGRKTGRRLVDEFPRARPMRLKWQRASSNLLAFNT